MTKGFAVACLFFLAEAGFSQDAKDGKAVEGFHFPMDLAGKRVEALLKPGSGVKGSSAKAKPLPRPAPRFLEDPALGMPSSTFTRPRLALPGRKITQPLHPAEPMPLAKYTALPDLPRPITLPAGELAYWPSVRVEKVPPLPILGLPKGDRAALADPTAETSLAFALKAVAVPRNGPVPFSPVNLPDPFELRQTVELRDPPAETEMPPLVTFPSLPSVK